MKFRILIAICLLPLAAAAQYTLENSTVDGGGGTATGGSWALTLTVGQPDAGTVSGGAWALEGGFLPGGPTAPGGDFIFSDSFESPRGQSAFHRQARPASVFSIDRLPGPETAATG